MFDHPKHLPIFPTEREQVKLAPGETPEAVFKSWFAKVTTPPRFCKVHPRTALILSDKESNFWRVPEESRTWGASPASKSDEFDFYVHYKCPACVCAYALCPPEFQETSFDTFATTTPERAAMLARTRDFAAQVNQRGRGFAVFVGPAGSGKTRLACNIIRELKDRDALYVRQGQLTMALRSTYGRKAVEYDEDGRKIDPDPPLEVVQQVRFLVLDEIGCTALANDERLLLDELFKHRYEQRKPTILISNLPLTGKPEQPGLKEFLGDALTDRIKYATGNGKYILQFTGESYRRTAGETYLAGVG